MAEVNASNAADAARAVRAANVLDGPSSVRRSATIGKLAAALAAAQSEMKNPKKEAENPHFKNKFADLAAVRDAVVPALAAHKLAVMQLPCEFNGAPALAVLLTHESGEWVETTIQLRPSKNDPQGIGSALTYMRRYTLQSLAGVVGEDDDDGNAASRPVQQQKPQQADDTALSNWSDRIAKAKTRDALTEVWNDYEAEVAAGKVPTTARPAILATFKAAGAKFQTAKV